LLAAASEDTESQVLCSDAITNFKTVQSFGYEDMIIDLFIDLNKAAQASVVWNEFK